MKQLVFFLLLSSFTYSQNYHYAIDRTKDTQPPSVPSNLTSSNTTETSTTISWDAATDNINVTNYQVYNNGILLVNSTGGISTTFVLTGLNPSTDYSLTIRAIDAAGNISGDSNIENFTTNSATIADTTPPSNPLNLEVSNITETSADLTWSVSTDNLAVIDYQVYNNGILIMASTGGVNTTTTLTGLNPGTDYNISVRAIDAAGNISGDSNNVEFKTDDIPAAGTYTLTEDTRISAGVYDVNDNLLRTLLTYEAKTAGTHDAPTWDGLDDEGKNVSTKADYIKIVSNNITANWEGIIGNTSKSFSGKEVINHFNPFFDGLRIDDRLYFCHDYGERDGTVTALDIDNIQEAVDVQHSPRVHPAINRMAWDGKTFYMAGRGGNADTERYSFVCGSALEDLDDFEKWLPFNNEKVTIFAKTWNVGDLVDSGSEIPRVTGLAVQKTNDNLFICREGLNSLRIIDKISGRLKQNLTYASVKHCKVDNDDNLWLVYGDSDETIEKFTVNPTSGAITSTGLRLTNFNNIQAITFSPDGNTMAVSDAVYGKAHQVFGFSVSTGTKQWTLGRNESYADDATVYNDKFYFYNPDDDFDMYGFLIYESDGSLWVSDRGNYRYLKFNPSRQHEDTVQWFEGFYNCNIDPKDPTRVWADYLEFKIDYSKTLQPGNSNQAWIFSKNWGASENLTNYDQNPFLKIETPVTLNNGRTYALMYDKVKGFSTFRMVELVEGGPMRDTGVTFTNQGSNTELKGNGTIIRVRGENDQQIHFIRSIIGFDTSNNPILGPETEWGRYNETTPFVKQDGPHEVAGEITENGTMVIFNGNKTPEGEYHLAGYRQGTNELVWKTAKGIVYGDTDPYPLGTNTFDLRKQVVFAGNVALAMDNWIVWGYNGEFWNQRQTNMWHMVHQDGLFLRDFGTNGALYGYNESNPEMAGNAFCPAITKVGNDVYLYHNDESYHAGLHRWKLSNLSSIKEYKIPIK